MRTSTVPSVVSVSGRRALGAVVAAALVGVAFAPPATGVALPPPSRAFTSADCPVEAPDEAAASDAAIRCGREVEVLDERTEWQTLHALPDGQMRLDTSVSAQRTQVLGEWTEIDTTLAVTAEGIAPVAPAVEMVFSDGTPGRPLARLQREGHELTYDVPFEVGEPLVYGTTLEYRDVVPGVDLIVTVDEDGAGFTEVLRVESPEAAADPRISELTFPVVVSDGLDLVETDGGFAATDASGEEVFTALPPVMWDSSADLNPPILTPRVSGLQMMTAADGTVLDEGVLANRVARQDAPLERDRAAVMGVEVDAAADAVILTPDAGILTDPATVWPVYIDPPVGSYPSGWISIRNDGWSDYNYSGDQGVGYCGTTGSPMYCSKIFTRRAMWAFGGLQAVGNAEPADVTQATMWVYGSHSYSCTAYPVQAWRVGGFSSGTTWATSSWGAHQSTQSLAHKPACSNARFIGFDVLEGARAVASVNASGLSLGLKAENEGSSTGWKRYEGSTASLSIVYNAPPNAPTGLNMSDSPSGAPLGCGTPTAPKWVNTTTPTLRATGSDPDGGNVSVWFYILDVAAGTYPWDGGAAAWQLSGTEHTRVVPAGKLVEGRQYRWYAVGYDPGTRTSVARPSCDFVIDLAAPAAPTVTPLDPTDATEAKYEGADAGGVGLTGRFLFASTSTDVAKYVYSVDSTAFDQVAEAAYPIGTFTPGSAGEHTLNVRTVDRAGKTSIETTTYLIDVAHPGESVWTLDEGTGTVAADTGDGKNQFPLSFAGSPTWVDGPVSDDDGVIGAAVAFDSISDVLTTVGPVTEPGQSFSVSAIIRSTGEALTASAVSSGAGDDAFALGQVSGAACPDGVGPCWAFSMPAPSGSGQVAAVSEDPIDATGWVQLTGIYDAATGMASLQVCQLWARPEAPSTVPASGVLLGQGLLRVGQSRSAGMPVSPWRGEVAEVRLYQGIVDEATTRITCAPGA